LGNENKHPIQILGVVGDVRGANLENNQR